MQNITRPSFGTITLRQTGRYMTAPFGRNVKAETDGNFAAFLTELEFILNTDRNTELYDGSLGEIKLAGDNEEFDADETVSDDYEQNTV